MTDEEAIENLNGCIVSEEYENGKPNGNVTCDLTRDILNTAIAALREKQERDNPQPLTLDELREMDGEPVYCTFTGTTICGNTLDNGWYIVSKNYEKTCIGVWPQGDDGVGMVEDTYGKTWLAYRYKPREAQT